MTELELFGYAVIAATGICVGVWLLVATYALLWAWESLRGKA
jgi:hypothetical protein